MAYDDSEALQPDSTYSIGDYSFDLNVSYIHEPDEDLVAISAICNGPDGRRESAPIYAPNGTTVESWTVEANETEASVYATTKTRSQDSPFLDGEAASYFCTYYTGDTKFYETASLGSLSIGGSISFEGTTIGTTTSGTWIYLIVNGSTTQTRWARSNFPMILTRKVNRGTRNGRYSFPQVVLRTGDYSGLGSQTYVSYVFRDCVLTFEDVKKESLVARFAIDIREADGGPDGDWDEPGDTGDPSYTLNVSVTGASSGSNSGIPLEAQEQSGYGSGGYGGNGGGGGAGASTVIIYEFATDKAGTVNQEATAQGPGTGGPGGKGGKGGDGCILIFY